MSSQTTIGPILALNESFKIASSPTFAEVVYFIILWRETEAEL
jgi:hypothetical protein